MDKWWKNKEIRRQAVFMIIVPLLGLLALILVHLLPTEPMREHLYWSLDMIEEEFDDELLIDGFKATLTGSFTDCLMLEHAVYAGGHSVPEQVLHMYRAESYYDAYDPSAWHPGESLVDYLSGNAAPREVEYSRYWHGYLIVLKPLLLITSFNSIRLFNAALQLLLVGICLILMTGKRQNGLAWSFLCSIPFLYYVSTYASLSQSICLYLMLLTVISLLQLDEHLEEKQSYGIFFLLVGMFTSYFDFLTYPIVTLCYPLSIYLYVHGENVRGDMKKIVHFSLEWAMGYLWMWASKWILADILSDCTTVKNAVDTIFTRTQSADGYGRAGGFLKVIQLNISPYLNWGYILFGVLILFGMIIAAIKNGKPFWNKKRVNLLPFVTVALIPFAWWFVTQNHSEQHWVFTCRIFAATVFALLAGVGKGIFPYRRDTYPCMRKGGKDETLFHCPASR